MSRQIQMRRGTADEHSNFTGAIGEITVDTTKNTIRVHDGKTAGGTALAKESDIPDLSNADYVVACQKPTAENNYVWYRKYKSGWIEQGGRWSAANINVSNSGENTTYIVLPKKMSDANYTVIVSGGTDCCPQLGIYETTNTLFRMKWGAYNTNRILSKFYWTVSGFCS